MKINGVDVESGIKRFGGKTDRYLKVLHSFAMGLEIDDTPMEITFSNENAEESSKNIHKIKGVAGNIGAVALYEALVEFENMQRTGTLDNILYNNIWLRMKETKESILNATGNAADIEQRPQGSINELRDLLIELLLTLKISEPTNCEAAVKALSAKSWKTISGGELDTINKAILDYDYDKATEAVNKIVLNNNYKGVSEAVNEKAVKCLINKNISVLIVDDSKENLSALRGILEDSYTIYVAANGERALKVADKNLPDIVLLDVVMPGIDGFETLKLMKMFHPIVCM